MLIKSTTGDYFINVLQAAFMHADLKSVKSLTALLCLLCFLGSGSVKVGSRNLMTLTPAVNFINIFARFFLTNVVFSSYVLGLSKKIVRKIRAFNVDEIDTWSLIQLKSPDKLVFVHPNINKPTSTLHI
jgi:hypothetical protein